LQAAYAGDEAEDEAAHGVTITRVNPLWRTVDHVRSRLLAAGLPDGG
jgi:hypothetical protein